MGRRTRRKSVHGIDFIVLGIISFMSLLLLYSAKWVEYAWEGIDFSTIMFQMHTPLNGVNSEVLQSYYDNCVPQTVRAALVILIVYWFFKCLFEKLTFSFEITLFHRSRKWILGKNRKVWRIISKVYFAAVLLSYAFFLYSAAADIGVFEYLHSINSKSTIFEREYVDPESIELVFPEKKRNLILIYLESMETTYASTEAGGGKPINYIPNLTEMAESNLYFSDSNLLGGGSVNAGCQFTMGAIVGTSSGVPFKSMIDGNSMSNYAQFLPGLTTLGDLLEQEGYINYFQCGSEAEFGGRQLFYEKHGNYQIKDYVYAIEKGYIPEDYKVFWGYEDAKLYEIAKAELEQIGSSGEAFNYTMLTVDTHHPEGYICGQCEDRYELPYANAISCSDRQVTEFVAWLQEQEWYSDTTVVLIGDHISMATDFWDDIGDYKRRTYNCFLNVPIQVSEENTKERKFNTLDYFPTILASMGVEIEGDRLGLGTNLFSGKPTLLEELGEEYGKELQKYSDYYVENFEK